MMNEMDDELLTVKQVATRLKLSTATIRRMLVSGKIPAIKAGVRQWRVSAKALQEYVEKGGKA